MSVRLLGSLWDILIMGDFAPSFVLSRHEVLWSSGARIDCGLY